MKLCLALFFALGVLYTRANPAPAANSTRAPPVEFKCMKEFYQKYCTEKDAKIFTQLQKCEDKNPPEIKELEKVCVHKVRKQQGKDDGELTNTEYQALECDAHWGEQFEKCMNASLTDTKMAELEKKYPAPKLDNIAKEIMHCDCDVYKIPHD